MADKKVVVIGAGPAGVNTACSLAESGFEVYLVDEKLGGVYCNYGSMISNYMLSQSSIYSEFKDKVLPILENKDELSLALDYKKIRKNIENLRNKLLKIYKEQLDDSGVRYIEGKACFIDNENIKIKKHDGSEETVKFYRSIIATGSKEIKFENISCKRVLSSSNISSMENTPKSIVIIGGGFVGCEFATFFKRLGVSVSIVEKDSRILKLFDEQITKKLEDSFRKDGVEIYLNKTVQNIDRVGNKNIIFLENDEKLEAEEVLISIGRVPNINNLNLEAAGVKVENNMLVLDENLRTTNKNIYAVGDATGDNMLVSWACVSSDIVVADILNKKVNKKYIFPKVAYLDPEVASVGLTESEAENRGYDTATIRYSYSDLEKSLITGHTKGYAKIIFDRKNKNVLGAHIIGEGASELISMFSIIIQAEIKVDGISEFVFNHPTFAEVISEIGSKAKLKAK